MSTKSTTRGGKQVSRGGNRSSRTRSVTNKDAHNIDVHPADMSFQNQIGENSKSTVTQNAATIAKTEQNVAKTNSNTPQNEGNLTVQNPEKDYPTKECETAIPLDTVKMQINPKCSGERGASSDKADNGHKMQKDYDWEMTDNTDPDNVNDDTTIKEVKNQEVVTTDPNTSGTRFKTLQSACKICDKICVKAEESIVCIKCKNWSHMACEITERQILIDLKYRGTFICESCKSKHHRQDSTSDLDSSMNSEERYRAEHDDFDLDIDEDALLGEDEPDNLTQKLSTDLQGQFDKLEKRLGNPSVNKMETKVTNSPSADRMQNRMSNHAMTYDNHSTPFLPSRFRFSKRSNMMNLGMGQYGSMNLGMNHWENPSLMEVGIAQLGNENYPPTHGPSIHVNQTDNSSSMIGKINELMGIVKEIKDDVNNIDHKVKTQESKNEEQATKASEKLQSSLQQTITQSLRTYDEKINKDIDRKVKQSVEQIDTKISQTVTKQMNEKLSERVDQKVNERWNQIEEEIEQRIGERIENRINDRVGMMINNKVESSLDEFEERMWKKKNVLIVNLPESKHESVEVRKREDMVKVYSIFNRFMPFDCDDAEDMPVRLGRISDKPRILRITLKSEVMVRTICQRARNQNHLLNPNENDSKRKIYINRDYTLEERENRLKYREEMKERISKGETNLVIRKRGVFVKNQPRNQRFRNQDNLEVNQNEYPNVDTLHQGQENESRGKSHDSELGEGISPLNRKELDEERRPKPNGRDHSPYIRDEQGRKIRGAEGGYNRDYDTRQHEIHRDQDYHLPRNNDYQGQIRDRSQIGRGRGNDQREYYTDDRRNYRENRQNQMHNDRRSYPSEEREFRQNENHYYASGRHQRQSSRQQNKHQPGSMPYGAPRFGRR